jgi:O-antigen/teichoic acid export membrane protein
MPPSLRKNFAWTLAGNLVFALCQWATIIAITKLSSVQVAGDWILGLAITAPIFVFAQFKLRIVQSSDARGENTWGEYVSVRLIGMGGALLAVGLIVAAAYRDATGALILAIALFKIFDAGSDLAYGLEQQAERMDRISASQTVRALISTAAGIAVFWATESAIATAGVMTAAVYLVCMVWDLLRVRDLLGGDPPGPSRDRVRVCRLFRRVLPLGFAAAIMALQVAVPRYFLEGYVSRAELGVFGALSYLPVFGAMACRATPRIRSGRASGVSCSGSPPSASDSAPSRRSLASSSVSQCSASSTPTRSRPTRTC